MREATPVRGWPRFAVWLVRFGSGPERTRVLRPGRVKGVKRDDVLGRSGNDLLSRALRHSTIGAEEFNGRVRDGIGFRLLAQVTGPAKDNIWPQALVRS